MNGVRCCKVAVAADAGVTVSGAAAATGSPGSIGNASSSAATGSVVSSVTAPASPPTVDARLRFMGDEKGRAGLEAGFQEFYATRMRRQRDVFSACVGALYVAVLVLSAANGSWVNIDFAYFIVVIACLMNLGLPKGTPAWVRNHASSVVNAAVIIVMDLRNSAADASKGEWFMLFLMYYALAPTLCGGLLMPPLKLQALMCTIHAVRAIVLLSPLGVLPVFLVCSSCAMGTTVVYTQEWRGREYFVSGSAACACVCLFCVTRVGPGVRVQNVSGGC